LRDLAQEVLGTIRLRIGEEFLRGVLLDDGAIGQEDHSVRRFARESHLVGHHDHGHALLRQGGHGVQYLGDHLRVEGGGRFVEEHDAGPHGQGPGNRHALLLPARELGGQLVGLVDHPDLFQQSLRQFPGLPFGLAADLDGAHGHVLQNGFVGEQIEGLEDHADLRTKLGQCLALGRNLRAVDLNGTRVDGLQPIDGPTEGRLSRAGRAEEYDDLTRFDRQIDVAEDVVVTEPLVDARESDLGAGL
jgi:hypothetical protein